MLLASAPRIVEARAIQLCSSLVRWADWKQIVIALPKSGVTMFTSDTHQSWFHPQVPIGDLVAPLKRTPKILGVTLNSHFTFSSHARDCVEQASRAEHHESPSWVELGLHWPLTRPLCTPSSTTPIPSGSVKCPQHTWTNLRRSRTRLRGSHPVAIKRLWCLTSEQRLGSSP